MNRRQQTEGKHLVSQIVIPGLGTRGGSVSRPYPRAWLGCLAECPSTNPAQYSLSEFLCDLRVPLSQTPFIPEQLCKNPGSP